MKDIEWQLKRKDLEIKGDQVGLLYMEHQDKTNPKDRFKENKLAMIGLNT